MIYPAFVYPYNTFRVQYYYTIAMQMPLMNVLVQSTEAQVPRCNIRSSEVVLPPARLAAKTPGFEIALAITAVFTMVLGDLALAVSILDVLQESARTTSIPSYSR
jgi:hypothetical protein